MRSYLSIVVVCLFLTVAGFAQVNRPSPGRTAPPNRAAQQARAKQSANRFIMQYGVQLSDAQKAQIKQIREQNAPDPALQKELRAILESRKNGPLTDAQKARAKAIQEQIAAKQKATHELVMKVYTAEQRAQMDKNRADLQQLHKDIMQRRQQFRQEHPLRLGLQPVKAGIL